MSANISQWDHISINWNFFRVPSVGRLLFGCRPSTVFGAIISVYVDSIKRMLLRWRHTHICNEIAKAFFVIPSIANPNPPPAIVCIMRIIGIVASIPHINPSTPNPSMPHSVGQVYLTGYISLKTSAGACIAALEGGSRNLNPISAVTGAIPYKLALRVFMAKRFNRKSGESLPGKVFELLGFSVINNGAFVHAGNIHMVHD